MQTRRETLRQGALAASVLTAGSLLSQPALAFNQAAFDGKQMADAFKALGVSGSPTESKDVTLTAPDIAENGAVVPMTVATTLPNVKEMLLIVGSGGGVVRVV